MEVGEQVKKCPLDRAHSGHARLYELSVRVSSLELYPTGFEANWIQVKITPTICGESIRPSSMTRQPICCKLEH